jgi:hypothetical protein
MYGSGECTVRLHDGVAGPAHVLVEVVVKHRGQVAVTEQPGVVLIEVVAHEDQARPMPGLEGFDDGVVSAADGVDRVDGRSLSKAVRTRPRIV